MMISRARELHIWAAVEKLIAAKIKTPEPAPAQLLILDYRDLWTPIVFSTKYIRFIGGILPRYFLVCNGCAFPTKKSKNYFFFFFFCSSVHHVGVHRNHLQVKRGNIPNFSIPIFEDIISAYEGFIGSFYK